MEAIATGFLVLILVLAFAVIYALVCRIVRGNKSIEEFKSDIEKPLTASVHRSEIAFPELSRSKIQRDSFLDIDFKRIDHAGNLVTK